MKSATEKTIESNTEITAPSIKSLFNYYTLRCNECSKDVKVSCKDELKQKHLDELQARIECNPCLDAKLLAKKK